MAENEKKTCGCGCCQTVIKRFEKNQESETKETK